MGKSFSHSADNLNNFLSQPGRAFYIPYYQRSYSWDEENAQKLISDIFSGAERALTKPNNTIFLGTIILHNEKNVKVGTHTDKPNLITKISNVVDGQQRITSISLLACVISESLKIQAEKLNSYQNNFTELSDLAQELENQRTEIQELFSTEIKKNGAQPRLKPIIIRAGDISSNPSSDQWTLAGDSNQFYRSNTASFLASFIEGANIQSITTDERINNVICTFQDYINDQICKVDQNFASRLIKANSNDQSVLHNFIDYPPNLQNLSSLTEEETVSFYGGILLLAVCSFLKNSCYFVVIECQDESLAFDMFQSLNATGTPLTAFEVFKPAIVNTYGSSYADAIKPEVDRIERVFETESSASGKEDITDRVIVSTALVYNGSIRPKKFSEERDWLFENFPKTKSKDSVDFISCIADQAEYYKNIIKPRKSPKNSRTFALVRHFSDLGFNQDEADIAALLLFYLRDAKHQFAHSVISIFYAKLLKAQSNSESLRNAIDEFISICKATASFFTLWMGALQGRFPDTVYRNLFQSENSNITVKNGLANQTSSFVKNAFKEALEEQQIYNSNDVVNSRNIWISKAKESPWYQKRAVCKFALFSAFHDAAPDISIGKEGLFIDGMRNSANFLNCISWHTSDYEVVEHIATRDMPKNIKYQSHFDSNIYPGNYSVVDKLGNLTLLSAPVNSSVYSEWPDKVFYYWSLTTPSSTANGPIANSLMSSLGISSLPPSLSSLSAASNFLSHLAPLAHRGVQGLQWDYSFIETRSEHLCGRVFDMFRCMA